MARLKEKIAYALGDAAAGGIVKGTDAENGVVVNGDGTMVINKLNVLFLVLQLILQMKIML